MRTVLLLTIVTAAFLSGCQGSPHEIRNRSDEALKTSPDNEILYAYSHGKDLFGEDKRLRAEMERRGMFTPEEWDRIDRKTFRLGDKEEIVWAAWGKPDDVSTLRTGDGVSKVLVYGDDADNRVYILNGRVSALGQ